MDQQAVVARLNEEQLAKMKAHRARKLAVSNTAQQMMAATMKALRDEERLLVEENASLWREVETAHGLNHDACYRVNFETGDVFKDHDHGPADIKEALRQVLGGAGMELHEIDIGSILRGGHKPN
jgi:hypothetical protein